MKFSEQWLRQWVNPLISTEELAEQLTNAGLEVESLVPVAPLFTHVVIGEIREIAQHPDADRLRVCQVDVGDSSLLTIVCGAPNARKGLKVPAALINAVLPGDFKIKKSKIRGVESQGMLCSESELGLTQTQNSAGILELPLDAPIGQDIRNYLNLDDTVFDLNITANRADCLSILGVAREVSAINQSSFNEPTYHEALIDIEASIPVTIQEPSASPYYLGRVIKNINITTPTPAAIKQKLLRSDIQPLSLIVDITNFVLLELGQPLHAFDLDQVKEGIEVRYARDGEIINLLNNQPVTLSSNDLVIASGSIPVALAGIKGGQESSITSATQDIFLESALFNPQRIGATSRKLKLFTDSSHRFERGVDYQLQKKALERATALIIEIAGGEVGRIIEVSSPYPVKQPISLRSERISQLLGIQLPLREIQEILVRLDMKVQTDESTILKVIPPSYRYDIADEIDLVEEVARLYGYQNIPPASLKGDFQFLPVSETTLSINELNTYLISRGYQEAITYSFVDPAYEAALALQSSPLKLANPIASDLSVMRTNHWPSLIKAFQYNYHRQQSRVRLFETGLCFINTDKGLQQSLRLGGVTSGPLYSEQWGEKTRLVDFYDIKNDMENLLGRCDKLVHFEFKSINQEALHPGQSAGVWYKDQLIGCFGAINPVVAEKLDIIQPLFLFDLDLNAISQKPLNSYQAISKYPAIRRDLALVVDEDIPSEKIRKKILDSGDNLLKNVKVIDVYHGSNIEKDKKSIAFGLFFQDDTRTLVDTEISDFMDNLITTLRHEFNAILRN